MTSSIEQLLEEHRTLKAMGERLRQVVAAYEPDAATVATLRWQLCRVLVDHCIAEDRAIYELLITSGDPEAVLLTLDLRDEVGCIDRDFRSYVADWPIDRIIREWDVFRAHTNALLERLTCRIAREEREVFPKVSRISRRKAA